MFGVLSIPFSGNTCSTDTFLDIKNLLFISSVLFGRRYSNPNERNLKSRQTNTKLFTGFNSVKYFMIEVHALPGDEYPSAD